MKVSPYTRPETYLEKRGVPLSAANDSEFYIERDESGDISPGEAIALAVAHWIDEHWPAVVLGLVTGMVAILVPAIVAARLAS